MRLTIRLSLLRVALLVLAVGACTAAYFVIASRSDERPASEASATQRVPDGSLGQLAAAPTQPTTAPTTMHIPRDGLRFRSTLRNVTFELDGDASLELATCIGCTIRGNGHRLVLQTQRSTLIDSRIEGASQLLTDGDVRWSDVAVQADTWRGTAKDGFFERLRIEGGYVDLHGAAAVTDLTLTGCDSAATATRASFAGLVDRSRARYEPGPGAGQCRLLGR